MNHIDDATTDDMLALQDLLLHIRGISPVAGSAMELGFTEDTAE